MIPGTQQPLRFDLEEGERRKEAGIALACSTRAELLKLAQATAERLGRTAYLALSYDDVYVQLKLMGENPALLGNAAGSVFRGKQWECVGWKKSSRVTNHARRVMVWKLRA